MPQPVVLVAEELSPAGIALLESDFAVRYADGSDRAALLPALADVDALIVRSATRVDAEALASAPKLRVVARAGVGLDNIDVDEATKAGVMVVNAPTSNIVSAAEHAVALLLAAARNIPQAVSSLKSGEWKRSRFTGVELHDKVVGILGLGRIGVLVAQRLSAFGMRVVAYDPYVPQARAAQIGVRMLGLHELLAAADFITVHLPRTAETLRLIGDRELHMVKPGVRIVNAARGGIIDEDALVLALKEGRVAGAGIDVYRSEPCTDSPLFGYDNVVVTPHLGASTIEAQEKAGTQVARSVKLALSGEFVPDAVNVDGGAVAEDVKPGLPLAEKLGRIFTSLAAGVAVQLDVEARGEIAAHDVRVLQLAALKVSVSGTLSGRRHLEKLVDVNGFEMEIAPAEHMAFFTYTDRPGIVGLVGNILGDQGINIAGMQVCRDTMGGKALIVLTVDSAIPPTLLDEITDAIGAEVGRGVDLDL